MNRRSLVSFLIVSTFLLAGCAGQLAPEPTPTASATETSTPSPTATLTPVPTATETPTATPEPSPTPEPISALDPELQQEVIEEFMASPENQQYASFEEALRDFEENSSYKPTIGSSWNGDRFVVGRYYLFVGHKDIPARALPGFSEDEELKVIFIVHPENPDFLIPITIAIKSGGDWQLLQDISVSFGPETGNYSRVTHDPEKYEEYFHPPKEIYVLGEDVELDSVLDSVMGRVYGSGVTLHLRDSNFDSSDLLGFYEEARRLVRLPGGYIEKFTNNPDEYLGEANQYGHRTIDPAKVVGMLDPDVDIGGFLPSEVSFHSPWR